MNHTEAVSLWRLAQACAPQQKFDDHGPDAWAMVLDDVTFEDGKAALSALAKRQAFLAPAELRAEARRIRRERLDRAPVLTPPADVADDAAAYCRWLGQTRKAIADGEDLSHLVELPGKPRDMRAIEGTFRRV